MTDSAPADGWPTDVPERYMRLKDFCERGIPFNAYVGLTVDGMASGAAVLRVPWRDALVGDPTRPSVHGGVTSMLVDTAGGMAVFTGLNDPRDRTSTVDLRVDYLRPAASEDLIAAARVVRMGNRVAVTEMLVYAGRVPRAGDRAPTEPIATGRGVYNVLRVSGERG